MCKILKKLVDFRVVEQKIVDVFAKVRGADVDLLGTPQHDNTNDQCLQIGRMHKPRALKKVPVVRDTCVAHEEVESNDRRFRVDNLVGGCHVGNS